MGVSIVKCKMGVVQEVEREDLVAISQVGLITLLQRLHSAQLNLWSWKHLIPVTWNVSNIFQGVPFIFQYFAKLKNLIKVCRYWREMVHSIAWQHLTQRFWPTTHLRFFHLNTKCRLSNNTIQLIRPARWTGPFEKWCCTIIPSQKLPPCAFSFYFLPSSHR